MGPSPSKLYILFLLFTFGNAYVSRQSVQADDTILDFLEGNVTDSPFDNDGTDFDIFSYLFAASSRANRLEEDIPGEITVLAPDDNAFRRAVGDLGLQTTSEQETYENFLIYLMRGYRYPFDVLTRILYYHVIPGEINSTTVLEMPSLLTWDTPSRISRDGNTLIDRNPDLPNPSFDTERMDIQASNGLIHVIDYVLFPEVMRKVGPSEVDNECNTPESTSEETGLNGGIGPFPHDSVMEATPFKESAYETAEPDQAVDESPVVILPQGIDQSIAPNPGPQEPTEVVYPLQSENSPQESEVLPSQEVTVGTPEAASVSEEPLLTSPQQTIPEVDATVASRG